MPCTTSPADFHQKSFRIKHHDHDKFFTRLLSKETSKSQPSFRVYYGDVSSAVPFTWETRPGTPKHPSCPHSDIPPLTPPPSYSYSAASNSSSTKQPGPKLLLHTLLCKMKIPKKTNSLPSHAPSLSISSSSSFSSSLSWTSSSRSLSSDPSGIPMTCAKRRRRFASWGSYFDRDHRPVEVDSCPNSNMCGKENGERSYVSLSIMKKAFLSIIGGRSSS